MFVRIIFTTLLLCLFNLCFAVEVYVIDGDTIKLEGETIRFSGIDAPEIKQKCMKMKLEVPCGQISKELIEDKIEFKNLNCISEGKDQYGRTLAECFLEDESLSSYLVRQGYAFAYRKYSKKFIKDEEFAMKNNKGMWGMDFIFPWDYRRQN